MKVRSNSLNLSVIPVDMGLSIYASLSRWFLGLAILVSGGWAESSEMSLREQTDCLCRVSGAQCDPYNQTFWVVNRDVGEGPLLVTSGPRPQMYRISFQGDHHTYGTNTSLVEIPSPAGPVLAVVKFDKDNVVRHSQKIVASPIELQSEIDHWNRIRKIERLLFSEAGVAIDPKERGIGTFLLRKSFDTGFFESEALKGEKTVSELIEEHDSGFARAKNFERSQAALFHQCTGVASLCGYGPNMTSQLSEELTPENRTHWQYRFEFLVRAYTQDNLTELEVICRGKREAELIEKPGVQVTI